jgi:hypothetical protein
MDLHLNFAHGQMSGEGTDDIGPFLIQGQYDPASGECSWTKKYPGSHEVTYSGFAENKGIWGTWEIRPLTKGGFHIWPRHAGNGEHARRRAGVETPVTTEAGETELILPRALRHSFS